MQTYHVSGATLPHFISPRSCRLKRTEGRLFCVTWLPGALRCLLNRFTWTKSCKHQVAGEIRANVGQNHPVSTFTVHIEIFSETLQQSAFLYLLEVLPGEAPGAAESRSPQVKVQRSTCLGSSSDGSTRGKETVNKKRPTWTDKRNKITLGALSQGSVLLVFQWATFALKQLSFVSVNCALIPHSTIPQKCVEYDERELQAGRWKHTAERFPQSSGWPRSRFSVKKSHTR